MSVNQRRSDWRVSITAVLLALGVIVVVMRTFQVDSYHDPMSPSFFPLLLSYLLLICGAAVGFRAWRGHDKPLDEDVSVRRYTHGALGVLVLAAYGFGVFYIGFWPSSLLAILGLSVLLLDGPVTRRFAWTALIIGLLTPAVIAFVFEFFAGVTMPRFGGLG